MRASNKDASRAWAWIVASVLGVAGLFVACGSEDEQTGPSGSSTRASTSGTASSSSSSSTASSSSGGGGSGACPSEAPMPGSDCSGSVGLLCDFGDQRCSCDDALGTIWECLPEACPVEIFGHEPPPTSCTDAGLACHVFELTCTCMAPEMEWQCCSDGGPPTPCPLVQPATGDLCCWSPMQACEYPTEGGTVSCECSDLVSVAGHFICTGP